MSSLPSLRCFAIVLIFGWLSSHVLVAQETAEQRAFSEAERHYTEANTQSDRYEKGRHMAYAVGLYIKYLDVYPGSKNAPAARFHLGYARQVLGRINEAKKTYQALLDRHVKGPYVGSAARQLAYLAFVEQNWEEAVKKFSIVAVNHANENLRHSALTKQVECLLKLRRTAEATVALRRIVDTRKHPHKEWALFMLGYQYYETGKFEPAIRILVPLLDEELASDYRSQALFYTGLAATELGRDDVAVSHLRTILKMPMRHPSLTPEQRKHLASNKAKAQTSLMGLNTKKKNWQGVVNLFEMGDFGAIGKVEARRSMRAGNAYMILQEYQKARGCFRRVDRAQPNTEMAFESSYKCLECDYHLSHPGLPERVDIFYEIYQEKFPDHEFMHLARFFQGETLYDQKAPEKAALVFNTIDPDKLSPKFQPELHFKNGWCLSESGQFGGATRSFGQFLAEFPDDPRRAEAHNKRAEAHFALGDYLSALRDFESVLDLETTPEQTAFALQGSARILREEKKYQSMIARYRRILSDFSDLPRDTIANTNYWIGWGFYKQAKYDDAPAYLQKARNLAPEFYSQPAGDLLILTAFSQRDKSALHTALQEIFAVAPAKSIPSQMLSWLGVQMFHDGQIKEAADYLERSTDPESPKRTEPGVWRILAKAQNRSGRFDNAQRTGQLLLKLQQEPRWKADAYLDLAEAQLGLQKLTDALDSAEKGLALNAPGAHIAGLHLIRGEVALHQQQWTGALDEFKKTITMVPDDPLLQPRALHGASIAAEKSAEAELANDYKAKLKAGFPKWVPTIKLTEPAKQ